MHLDKMRTTEQVEAFVDETLAKYLERDTVPA